MCAGTSPFLNGEPFCTLWHRKNICRCLECQTLTALNPCVCVTASRLPVSSSCMTHAFVYLIVTCTGDWTLWLMMTLIWHTHTHRACVPYCGHCVSTFFVCKQLGWHICSLGQIRSDLQGNIVFIPTAPRVNVSPSEWWMMCVMGPEQIKKKNATILGLSCCFCHFCFILRCLFMHVPIIFSVYKFESR